MLGTGPALACLTAARSAEPARATGAARKWDTAVTAMGLPVRDAGQESKGPSWAAVEGRLAVCRVGRGAPRFAPRAERNDSAPRAWLVSIAS